MHPLALRRLLALLLALRPQSHYQTRKRALLWRLRLRLRLVPPLLASLALLLALRPQSHHQIRKRALLRRLRLVPPLLASLRWRIQMHSPTPRRALLGLETLLLPPLQLGRVQRQEQPLPPQLAF